MISRILPDGRGLRCRLLFDRCSAMDCRAFTDRKWLVIELPPHINGVEDELKAVAADLVMAAQVSYPSVRTLRTIILN